MKASVLLSEIAYSLARWTGGDSARRRRQGHHPTNSNPAVPIEIHSCCGCNESARQMACLYNGLALNKVLEVGSQLGRFLSRKAMTAGGWDSISK